MLTYRPKYYSDIRTGKRPRPPSMKNDPKKQLKKEKDDKHLLELTIGGSEHRTFVPRTQHIGSGSTVSEKRGAVLLLNAKKNPGRGGAWDSVTKVMNALAEFLEQEKWVGSVDIVEMLLWNSNNGLSTGYMCPEEVFVSDDARQFKILSKYFENTKLDFLLIACGGLDFGRNAPKAKRKFAKQMTRTLSGNLFSFTNILIKRKVRLFKLTTPKYDILACGLFMHPAYKSGLKIVEPPQEEIESMMDACKALSLNK